MADSNFNGFQYNTQQYGFNSPQQLESVLEVLYSVETPIESLLSVEWSMPLEAELNVEYSILVPLSSLLSVEFQIGNEFPAYLESTLHTRYSVAEILTSTLDVNFGIQFESSLDVIYDVGNIVYSDLDVEYSILVPLESELVVDFTVEPVKLESELVTNYSVYISEPPATVIVESVPVQSSGYRIPYGYEEDVDTWPPTRLVEVDGYGRVTTSQEETSDITYAVGALAFATNLYIINNQCAQVNADRMLNMVPSEIRTLAWDAEHSHQLASPSTLNLMALDGSIGVAIKRLPADIGRLKDVEVWVSGISPSGSILPAHQKTIYLRYGDPPNMIVESYFGTIDELSAQIVRSSDLVELHAPKAVLDNALSPVGTQIRLVDSSDFPDTGYAVINGEVIYYETNSNNVLGGVSRGVFDTTANSHLPASEVFSCYSYGRTILPAHPVTGVSAYTYNKLANVRNIALVNNSNSGHFALWKTLGTELCLIWSQFYNQVNKFFVRFAKLKDLLKIAQSLHTNLWSYLNWIKLAGHIRTSIAAEFIIDSDGNKTDNFAGQVPFMVAISGDPSQLSDPSGGLYNMLYKYGLVGGFGNKPMLFKIDREYVYADWIGTKAVALELAMPVDDEMADDPNAHYVIRVIERAVEFGRDWTVGVAHSKFANIEYIPTDLKSFSRDGQLLMSAKREPSHLFRERLRLYRGNKANFESFREVYDVLEDIIPGSQIDIWDYWSAIAGKPNDPFGPIIDREVGWLLGVPGRTEFSANTYLGLQTFTQGYWEWLWNDSDSQLLQVKGTYPFFVRAKNWWFDPELLYEVTDRFKSAGTTPNYSINKEMVGFISEIRGDDGTNRMSAFADNIFENFDMQEGIVSEESAPLSGSIVRWTTVGTGVSEPELYIVPVAMHTDPNIGASHPETTAAYAAKVTNNIAVDIQFSQRVSLAAGSYLFQCYIKPLDNVVYDATDRTLEVYNTSGDPITGWASTGVTVMSSLALPHRGDIPSGWYTLQCGMTVAADGDYDVGINIPDRIADQPVIAVSNLSLVQTADYEFTNGVSGGDQYALEITSTECPKAGWYYISDGGDSEFVYFNGGNALPAGTWRVSASTPLVDAHLAAVSIYAIDTAPHRVSQSLSVNFSVNKTRYESTLGAPFGVA